VLLSYDFEMKFDLGASGKLIFFFSFIDWLSVWLGNLEIPIVILL
jgi:hypothetical protein